MAISCLETELKFASKLKELEIFRVDLAKRQEARMAQVKRLRDEVNKLIVETQQEWRALSGMVDELINIDSNLGFIPFHCAKVIQGLIRNTSIAHSVFGLEKCKFSPKADCPPKA